MLLYHYNLMNFKKYLKGTDFALDTQLYQHFLIFFQRELHNFLHIVIKKEIKREKTGWPCELLILHNDYFKK